MYLSCTQCRKPDIIICVFIFLHDIGQFQSSLNEAKVKKITFCPVKCFQVNGPKRATESYLNQRLSQALSVAVISEARSPRWQQWLCCFFEQWSNLIFKLVYWFTVYYHRRKKTFITGWTWRQMRESKSFILNIWQKKTFFFVDEWLESGDLSLYNL